MFLIWCTNILCPHSKCPFMVRVWNLFLMVIFSVLLFKVDNLVFMLMKGALTSTFYSLSTTSCNYCTSISCSNSKTKYWVAKVLSKVFLILSLSSPGQEVNFRGFSLMIQIVYKSPDTGQHWWKRGTFSTLGIAKFHLIYQGTWQASHL